MQLYLYILRCWTILIINFTNSQYVNSIGQSTPYRYSILKRQHAYESRASRLPRFPFPKSEKRSVNKNRNLNPVNRPVLANQNQTESFYY